MLRVLGASSKDELTKSAEQVTEVFLLTEQGGSSTNEPPNPNELATYETLPSINHFRSFELKLVNRLYAQTAYKIEQEFLDIVHRSFQSDVQLEDFENESAKAVQTINTWVESQTNNRIRDILSTNDVKSDTRLVLINCIYFKVNIIL